MERNWRRVEVFVPADRANELRAFARQLRSGPKFGESERLNDRVKLLYHRLVARRIRHDPRLIERARGVARSLPFARADRTYVEEWRRLLDRPVAEIAAALTSRSSQSRRLRLNSPFPLVDDLRIDDPALRRRIWSVVKRPFARTTS
jgi:hypothetical protein